MSAASDSGRLTEPDAEERARRIWCGALVSSILNLSLDYWLRPGSYSSTWLTNWLIWTGSSRPYSYDALYYDIVPGYRIVYSYEMCAARDRISVSLATVEISPDQDGTRLTYTEQHAFPDGTGKPGAREEGTAWMLDNLGRYLASHAGS
jgi:hypothetical protein